MTIHRRLHQALPAHLAVGKAPSLAHLMRLVAESNERLKAIESLFPESLRPAIKAGPIDGKNWCLLVNGNAAAAKTRQLLPVIQARLLRGGWEVTTIRLKIMAFKK